MKGITAWLPTGLVALATTLAVTDCPAGTVTYTYDPLGRVLSAADSSDATCVHFKYDPAGNRSRYTSSVAGSPTAANDTVNTLWNVPVTFDPRVNDASPSCYPLVVTSVTTPGHGAASFAATSITYAPNRGYSGADGFTYAISDGHGGSASAGVSVTVQAVALTATVDQTQWTWRRYLNNPATQSPPRVASAAGGQPPYSYAGQYVSGDTQIAAQASASAATSWTRTLSGYGIFTALWRGQITDSAGAVAYTPNVTVTFDWESNQ